MLIDKIQIFVYSGIHSGKVRSAAFYSKTCNSYHTPSENEPLLKIMDKDEMDHFHVITP